MGSSWTSPCLTHSWLWMQQQKKAKVMRMPKSICFGTAIHTLAAFARSAACRLPNTAGVLEMLGSLDINDESRTSKHGTTQVALFMASLQQPWCGECMPLRHC